MENQSIKSIMLVPSSGTANNVSFERREDLYCNNPHLTRNGASFFTMLDAAAILRNQRRFETPADDMRPVEEDDFGKQQDGMHYLCEYMLDSFIASREHYYNRTSQRSVGMPWDIAVRSDPSIAFPTTQLECMSVAPSWIASDGFP